MAWLKTLAETYDVYADLAGKEENDQPMLLPVFHSTFNAQIEVTIDGQGNFKDARRLEKGKGVVTIIPVTRDSATEAVEIPRIRCVISSAILREIIRYTPGTTKKSIIRNTWSN